MSMWKDIPGYEGLYQASDDGFIRSVARQVVRSDGVVQLRPETILSPATNASGYHVVSLRKDGAAKSHLVSRLVALTYIENSDGLPEVNHKNEIKTDNRVSNLEWIDRVGNCNYGTRNKRHSEHVRGKYTGAKHSHPHPVICLTTGQRFDCIRMAKDYFEMKSASGISACCRGVTTYSGRLKDGTRMKWAYADP